MEEDLFFFLKEDDLFLGAKAPLELAHLSQSVSQLVIDRKVQK